MPKRIAVWNPARDVWETTQVCLCGHSDVWSETWPASGMTRSGVAYVLPTWGHLMDDSESSLLPTPRAARGASATETVELLPTPRTSDTNGTGEHGTGGADLRTVVEHCFPHRKHTMATSAHPEHLADHPKNATHLATAVEFNITRTTGAKWGKYAPAVHQWETITRPAPPPTQPSKKTGRPQLSPAFVEWMMGLPPGHVTNTNTSRTQQLRALGNGVVPQQATAALTHLLTRNTQ